MAILITLCHATISPRHAPCALLNRDKVPIQIGCVSVPFERSDEEVNEILHLHRRYAQGWCRTRRKHPDRISEIHSPRDFMTYEDNR